MAKPVKNKLQNLLMAIQSGKKLVISHDKHNKKVIRLKTKVTSYSTDSLLKAWVLYKIRYDVEIGYSNYKSGYSDEHSKEIKISKEIWNLCEKERENEILRSSKEINVKHDFVFTLGKNPCYIVGYEWMDPEKQIRARRDFLIGAEYCYG